MEFDWMEPVDTRQEAEDFENGSEDMELRAMRQEAEEDAAQDAYCGYLDLLEERGGTDPVLSFEDFRARPRLSAPAPIVPLDLVPGDPAEVFGDDDIPF